MKTEFEIKEEIMKRQNEIKYLEDQIEVARLYDWKKKEGKYWLVETYPVNGKTEFRIHHVIEITLNSYEGEYVDMTNKYISRHKYDFLIEPFCMKWTETTKKEFDKQCKRCEDFRIKLNSDKQQLGEKE